MFSARVTVCLEAALYHRAALCSAALTVYLHFEDVQELFKLLCLSEQLQ